MKSIFVFALLLAVYVSSALGHTECTRNGGCIQYDRNGNGIRCGPDGCGPVNNQQRGSYNGRQNNNNYNNYNNRNTEKCGRYGCVSDSNSRNNYGNRGAVTTGNARCGDYGCVTK